MDKFEGKWVSSSCMFDKDGKLNITFELRVISEFVDNSGLVKFETKFVSFIVRLINSRNYVLRLN